MMSMTTTDAVCVDRSTGKMSSGACALRVNKNKQQSREYRTVALRTDGCSGIILIGERNGRRRR